MAGRGDEISRQKCRRLMTGQEDQKKGLMVVMVVVVVVTVVVVLVTVTVTCEHITEQI